MHCGGILAALVDAVASITGQDASDVHTELDQHSLGASAARDDVRAFVARVETRLGLAPRTTAGSSASSCATAVRSTPTFASPRIRRVSTPCSRVSRVLSRP